MPKENGKPYDLKTIAASLKRQGLVAKAARKFKATTNSKHNLPVFDNLLQQDFSATAPNQKWAGDITYLWTDEGWPVSGRHHRPVFPASCWLVHERTDDGGPGLRCTTDGGFQA
jgi:transposase InsO family protein